MSSVAHLFEQHGHAHCKGVHPEHGGELIDLHDFFLGGAISKRILDMDAQTGLVEMRGCRIDGDIDELLYLRLQPPFLPGNRRKFQIDCEEVWIELQ